MQVIKTVIGEKQQQINKTRSVEIDFCIPEAKKAKTINNPAARCIDGAVRRESYCYAGIIFNYGKTSII